MKKFSEIIQIQGEPDKNAPGGVIKGRVAITKANDDKMLAFGWANVAVTADGERIEDWQHDIIEPEELENAAYNFVELYREGGEMHERGGSRPDRIGSIHRRKDESYGNSGGGTSCRLVDWFQSP